MTAPSPPSPVDVDHLAALEAEAVHIIREVIAELDRPVLLFSGGKDSVGHRQTAGAGYG
jgi:sulfate adenylyltransferase subunit 2